MLILLMATVPYVLLDSWVSRAWAAWPRDIFPAPARLHKRIELLHRLLSLCALARAVSRGERVRCVPPDSMLPVRMQPVLEGSADGVHWQQYGYKHIPSLPGSKLGFIAPYHARLDQWSFYVGQGIDGGGLFGGVFPGGSPYWAKACASTSWK
ncbi:MAG: hypothetical protein U5L01_04075 [Rheinheimera sp.]|nr:hypothetical protein [Rheinheimera sp.]